MWNYEKRLQYPVKITQTNPQIAKVIISQFGGPDGELAASIPLKRLQQFLNVLDSPLPQGARPFFVRVGKRLTENTGQSFQSSTQPCSRNRDLKISDR